MSVVLSVALTLAAGCKDRRERGGTRDPEPVRTPPTLVDRIDASLRQGAAYLRGLQAEDGSVRGELYAAFRGGRELTPLVGLALAMSGQGEPADAAARRAAGFVASADDVLAYPVYDLALAALFLNLYSDPDLRASRDTAIDALRRYQLGPDGGWAEGDLSYGGWSYAAEPPAKPPPGTRVSPRLESNLSATVFAVGAIALSRPAPFEDQALKRARIFVERCQNFDPTAPGAGDGGFFFSPRVADSNKAGEDGDGFRSYGSATADGVRALMRLGSDAGEPRVLAAKSWLVAHFDPTRNPGSFPDTHEVRRASSYYYYAWSVAHAMRLLGESDWAPPLAEELLRRQKEDGSWSNPAGEMREDEPAVATALAMAALAIARGVIAAEYRSHRAAD